MENSLVSLSENHNDKKIYQSNVTLNNINRLSEQNFDYRYPDKFFGFEQTFYKEVSTEPELIIGESCQCVSPELCDSCAVGLYRYFKVDFGTCGEKG